MKVSSSFFWLFLTAFILGAFVVWPEMDLVVSGLFAAGEKGFLWKDNVILRFLNEAAFYGAYGLGVLLIVLSAVTFWRPTDIFGLDRRALFFLLSALVLGPGLVANIVFKDHWGRARPQQIEAFGGQASFAPALIPAQECVKNCSFVSGDGAFGFFLTSFAFVAPPSKRRRVFWGGVLGGVIFGGGRILSGSHFLSDVLYAAFFMIGTSTLLAALFWGKERVQSVFQTR